MYLMKTKRVETLSAEDYNKITISLPCKEEEFDRLGGLKKLCPNIKDVEQLDVMVKLKGKSFKYLSIKEEIGYWRKANHIHNWFVEKCQDNIDQCQLTEISKEQLEELLEECYEIIHKNASPEEALPTVGGFFFGGTDYDEYYYQDIKETIRILEEAIVQTDWEKEIVFYQSSW